MSDLQAWLIALVGWVVLGAFQVWLWSDLRRRGGVP